MSFVTVDANNLYPIVKQYADYCFKSLEEQKESVFLEIPKMSFLELIWCSFWILFWKKLLFKKCEVSSEKRKSFLENMDWYARSYFDLYKYEGFYYNSQELLACFDRALASKGTLFLDMRKMSILEQAIAWDVSRKEKQSNDK